LKGPNQVNVIGTVVKKSINPVYFTPQAGNLFLIGVAAVEPAAMAHRPQSSSASRFTAGASGFFILSQSGERPER
jgi:hypothetical protein